MSDCWAEPTLDELLGDSLVRLLMASDGVQESTLRELLGSVQRRQGAGAAIMPAGCACA
jgi:hypothetical protein